MLGANLGLLLYGEVSVMNENLHSDILHLKTQLELKDKFVANLSDRRENIRLEYEEGTWSSVKATKSSDCATQETTAIETSPGSLIETKTTNVINPTSIFGISRTLVQEAESGAKDTVDLKKNKTTIYQLRQYSSTTQYTNTWILVSCQKTQMHI